MKFKCIHTGQVYEFAEHDIKGMQNHPDYVEVKEEPKEDKKAPAKTVVKAKEAE